MRDTKASYRKLLMLMILSLVLLTGFMAWWLAGRYNAEREELEQVLTEHYRRVHESELDSLVLERLVLPSMKDSLGGPDTVSVEEVQWKSASGGKAQVMVRHFSSDSAEGIRDKLGMSGKPGKDSLDEPHILTLNLTLNEEPDPALLAGINPEVLDSISIRQHSDQKALVKTVKLFIDQTDPDFLNNPSAHIFAMRMDEEHFLESYSSSLEDAGFGFRIGIASQEEGSDRGTMIIGPESGYSAPLIRTEGYRGHLLGLLLPQFMFALIMLGLTATALVLAYRSLLRQQALSRMREEFIANISHELKTPVSTVKVALEALQSFELSKDPDRFKEYLQMASHENGRLEKLVSRVLHHQVLQEAPLRMQLEDCDLGEILGNVLRAMELPLREKNAILHHKAPETPVSVCADPLYLESVLINLVDNSLKYGGDRPEISIAIRKNEKGSILTVLDSGPGIPPEYRKLIFEKFFRVPTGDLHHVKGSGLGLSFTALVMEQLRGSVRQENPEEGGCLFTLCFPPCPPKAETDPDRENPEPKKAEGV